MPVTLSIHELAQAEDIDLGVSDWVEVTQERIDLFADATGDHQWIHVDPEKAAEGPFGRTIAHGYLTISLLPELVTSMIDVTGARMGVNYGIEKLRLTNPVPSGSKVRAKARIVKGQPKGGGVLYEVDVEVQIEDVDKPALLGTVLYLVYGDEPIRRQPAAAGG